MGRGAGRRRAWTAGIAVSVIAAGVPAAASAESVAYIDGREVWVSTLDGAHKKRLSAGENEWLDVAHASGGKVLGIRNEPGKLAQYSGQTLWGTSGSVEKSSILPNAHSGSSLATPLNIDLVPDATSMVWGYSALYFAYPVSSLYVGTYVSAVGNALQPVTISDMKYPALAGRRLVAVSGRTVYSQNDVSSAPFGTANEFTPWLDTSDTGDSTWDLDGVATSADGRRVAAWLNKRGEGSATQASVVDVVFTQGLGVQGAVTSCHLPLQGVARSTPSISADGAYISWHDDGGVKVAPMPSSGAAGQPCVMSGSPVVVSPTGSQPDLGGFPVPVASGGGPSPTGTGSSATTALARITVTAPASVAATKLPTRGIAVRLRPPSAGGRAVVRLLVPGKLLGRRKNTPVVVGAAAKNLRKGIAANVVVKPAAPWRAKVAKLKGRTIRVQVVFRGRATIRSVRLT